MKNILTAVILFLCCCGTVLAQEVDDVLEIYFRKEKGYLEGEYRDNKKRAEVFFDRIRQIQKIAALKVVRVECVGSASPEGDRRFNEIIAEARERNVTRFLRKNIDVPDSLIVVTSVPEDWENLAKAVEADPAVRKKDKVLEIIRSGGSDRIERLLQVDYGRPYWYMYHNIFPDLRAYRVTFVIDYSSCISPVEIEDNEEAVCFKEIDPALLVAAPLPKFILKTPKEKRAAAKAAKNLGKELSVVECSDDKPSASPKADSADNMKETKAPAKRSHVYGPEGKQIRLKTNAIGWGMGVTNVAAEIDFADNWSVNIPFYYCGGYNYFRQDLKFRVCIVQPEVRYHFPKVDGLFAGVHLGVGWFNYALAGDYRIQDSDRRPAFGGGLGVGYRLNFRQNPRWAVEFALGAGVYSAKYDKLYNEKNGPYAERYINKVFFGVDNAAVSFIYSFDLKKKEGRK